MSDSQQKKPIPLSPIVPTEQFLFLSGQVPDDLTGSVEDETRQVLEKIRRLLEGAGSSMDKVVKTTVFLTDIGDFAAMNEVYAQYFPGTPPARSTVRVDLAIDAKVEIEAIALAAR